MILEIEKLRRTRGSLSKEIILNIIGKHLVQDTVFNKFDLLVDYEKIENGYKKKTQKNKELIDLEKSRQIAIKKIFRDWRKVYKNEFLISILLGNKRCPKCGHPMMANLKGLFGISCPDCGYIPYLTMFSICDCGNYEVIKPQPELSDSKIFTYINDFYCNDKTCSKCKKLLSDTYFEFRVVMLPVPYPFDNFHQYSCNYQMDMGQATFDNYKNIDENYSNNKCCYILSISISIVKLKRQITACLLTSQTHLLFH